MSARLFTHPVRHLYGTAARIALSIVLLITMTGCWSSKSIQVQGYATALGIDYKEGMFTVYVQLLDFSSIAKKEGAVLNPEAAVWVGKGMGRTLNDAVNDVYKTSQLSLFWGHITAIVLSESVLMEKGILVADMLVRYPEIRYNAWLYGTREPIDKLLSATPLFRLSPLDSILHHPEDSYKQYSMFKPILFFKYISDFKEEAVSAFLPSLALNNTQWKENEKEHPLLTIDGAFVESDRQVKGFMPRSKLLGYHWMEPKMYRAPLPVIKDGVVYGQLSVMLTKLKIKPVVQGSTVKFRVKAKYLAGMYEYDTPISAEEMTQIASDTIKKEIMETYEKALAKEVDIYNLEERLYRKNPTKWHELTDNGKHLFLDKQSIEKLDLKLDIVYNGKHKRVME
ncbi:Ger(x)C family spore germination protein [Paenibacillus sp. NPDC058071]|uniref:Ger(x)C family spore germination protein n=1 Tax=Paenibacillus sp. NPDC058071 TaxID=3346326 RepID=UPI0036D86C58